MGDFAARIADQEWWSGLGFLVLVAGLIGDVIVLGIPEHKRRLEKALGVFFIVVVIIGCAFEHEADNRISNLVAQEQSVADMRVAAANNEAATARRETESLKKETEWRRLTRAEYDAVAAFARADGRHTIRCDSTIDPETGPYADDICGALKDGGWSVGRGTGLSGGGTIIGLQVYPGPNGLPEATAFANQLAIKANVHVDILVGRR